MLAKSTTHAQLVIANARAHKPKDFKRREMRRPAPEKAPDTTVKTWIFFWDAANPVRTVLCFLEFF